MLAASTTKLSLNNIGMAASGEDSFKSIAASTGLLMEQIEALKTGFDGFDTEGTGIINPAQMQVIFKMMGNPIQKDALDEVVEEFSAKAKSKGKEFGFEGFCQIAAKFLTEEDEEKLKEELKEAFRIYDKQGNGYITTTVLKEILKEIDPELTNEDLENIIDEVDEDGSGTVDFLEFQEMMLG